MCPHSPIPDGPGLFGVMRFLMRILAQVPERDLTTAIVAAATLLAVFQGFETVAVLGMVVMLVRRA